VNAVKLANLVDAQAVQEVKPQDGALASLQRLESLGQRAFDDGAIVRQEQLKLGRVRVGRVALRSGGRPSARSHAVLSLQAERFANRDHANPGVERRSCRVAKDGGARSCEEKQPNSLSKLLPIRLEQRGDRPVTGKVGEVPSFEMIERDAISTGAGDRQIEVVEILGKRAFSGTEAANVAVKGVEVDLDAAEEGSCSLERGAHAQFRVIWLHADGL
jgi:hypothetical protein